MKCSRCLRLNNQLPERDYWCTFSLSILRCRHLSELWIRRPARKFGCLRWRTRSNTYHAEGRSRLTTKLIFCWGQTDSILSGLREGKTIAYFSSFNLIYAVKVNHISTLARHLNPSDAATRTGRAFPSGISGNPSTSHIDISASLGSNPLDQRDHQILCDHCRQVCNQLYISFHATQWPFLRV